MVTLQSFGDQVNRNFLHIVGLSTDAKPTTIIENMRITNGSTFEELDTGNTYKFNASSNTWIPQPASSGGGGADGLSAYEVAVADGFEGDETAWLLSLKGAPGSPGTNGVSPTITPSKTGKITTLTIKDVSGTKTATINDGADGGVTAGVVNIDALNPFVKDAVFQEEAIYTHTTEATTTHPTNNSIALCYHVVPAGLNIKVRIKIKSAVTIIVRLYQLADSTYTQYYSTSKTFVAGWNEFILSDIVTLENTYLGFELPADTNTYLYYELRNNAYIFSKLNNPTISDYTSLASSLFTKANGVDFLIDLISFVKATTASTKNANNIKNRLPRPNGYIVVDAGGNGDYTTVGAAISAATTGGKIFVMPGMYKESVSNNTKDLTFVGLDLRECIIYNELNTYGSAPLNCTRGTYRNLTFYSKFLEANAANGGSYALHIDNYSTSDLTSVRVVEFTNCIFKSESMPAVGMGSSAYVTFKFIDCEFIQDHKHTTPKSDTFKGSFYIHGTTNNTNGLPRRLELIRCRIISDSDQTLYVDDNEIDLVAEYTLCYSTKTLLPSVSKSAILNPCSYGNNASELNYTS